MSLKPQPIQPIPKETVRIALATFPKGNPYLMLRDELGTVFGDDDFAALFPDEGQLALPPWRLALVTLMQFRENLSDRQAAEAVRSRIDWKYLLGLRLSDPGFDFSVLSEFRARLIAGEAEHLLLEKLLERCRNLGLVRAFLKTTNGLYGSPCVYSHSQSIGISGRNVTGSTQRTGDSRSRLGTPDCTI